MRGLRETSLDSRRESRTLCAVEPSLHRIVGFESKNRQQFRLQAGDRAQYFGADEAGKIPRRVGNRDLRLKVLAGFILADQVRRYGGCWLWSSVGSRIIGGAVHEPSLAPGR